MAKTCILSPLKLKQKLQKMIPNFAYQMITYQMMINDEKNYEKVTITDILRLMDIYMNGVEVLQSQYDPRFHFFCRKIQQLMRKKSIVQQIHINSTGKKLSKQAYASVKKHELETKKQQHKNQIFLNQRQIDQAKIQNILKAAQTKLSAFYGKITFDIQKQQDRLYQRLSRRKMKSQTGSINKFKINDQNIESPRIFKQNEDKNERQNKNIFHYNRQSIDEYFDGQSYSKIRRGSIQKTKSFSNKNLVNNMQSYII